MVLANRPSAADGRDRQTISPMPLKRESFTNGLSHMNFPWEATKLMKGYTKLIGGVKAK